MAKQTINIGSSANKGDGDPLRTAFDKVNDNFDELYARAENTDSQTLTLVGNTLSISGGNSVTLTSTFSGDYDDLTNKPTIPAAVDLGSVSEHIVPSADNTYDLGAADKQWRSLYVSSDTIFIGGISLKIDGENRLIVGDDSTVLGGAVSYNDLTDTPTIPTDISNLTDTQGLLGGDTGNITFDASTISAPGDATIRVEARDEDDDEVTARLILDPNNSTANLESLVGDAEFFGPGFGYSSGEWVNNNGVGQLILYDAQVIFDFLNNNSLFNAGDNRYFRWNSGNQNIEFVGLGGETTITLNVGSENLPPADPTPIANLDFLWINTSGVSVDSNDSERIRIVGRRIPVEIETDRRFDVDADDIRLYSREDSVSYIRLYAGNYVRIRTNDHPDSSGTNTWQFNNDSSLTIPGDIKSENAINIDINLSDSTLRRWRFGEDGDLTIPGRLILSSGGVQEAFQSKVDATGVVTHDCALGQIFYHTSPDANWTANFTNLDLGTSVSTNLVLVVDQGTPAYYPSAVQIGGVAQTIKWLGNVTPTPSANKTEIATFTIFNNAGTFTVLGSYSTYG